MAEEPVAVLQDPTPLVDAVAAAVDAGTDTRVATPSPGSAKRRNRKKSRRQNAGATESGTDATADEGCSPSLSMLDDAVDQVSQPSPVASVESLATGAPAESGNAGAEDGQDAVTEQPEMPKTVQEALEGLLLTSESEVQLTPAKDESALMMQLHQSSGRLPSTPPPTPEPYFAHSPDAGFPRVAPVNAETQIPPTPVNLSTQIDASHEPPEPTAEVLAPVSSSEADASSKSMTSEMNVQDSLPSAAAENATSPVDEQLVEVQDAQAAPMQNDTELVAGANGVAIETVACESPVANQVQESQFSQLSEDDIAVSSAGEATDIEPSPVIEVPPSTEKPASDDLPVPSMTTKAFAELSVSNEDTPILSTGEEATQSVSDVAEVLDPVQLHVEAPSMPLPTEQVPDKIPPPSAPEVATYKTKGAVAKRGRESEPIQTEIIAGKKTVGPNQAAHTRSIARPSYPTQRTKKKDETPSVQPPPAPVTAGAPDSKLVVTAPIRTRSGSKVIKTESDTTTTEKLIAAVKRTSRGSRSESMMNPTASSAARATAAEGRRALMKSTAPPKGPSTASRKPVRSSITSGTPMGKLFGASISAKEKTVAAPTDEDAHRNVKRRFTAVDAAAASARLYQDAKESKLRRDIRRAELEETYSFTPQVNPLKRHSSAGGTAGVGEVNHFSRLHAQAKELLEKKRELQHQHERDGCTFAPAITARAKRMSQTSSVPRYEDLYKQAQTIKQKREEKQLEMAKTAEEECPFKPKISASKSPVKTRPLYDSEREKQKKLALEQKKIETEMSQCTFKPKVGALKRSKVKAEDTISGAAPPSDSTFYDRLYQASIQRAERLEKLRQERDQEEKSLTPFQPKITSSRSRAGKSQSKVKQPFHKRLYSKDYMQKLTAAREQRRLEGEQQFTFKPQITEPPEEIKEKTKERADSPGKNIFERLYGEKDKLKEKIEIGEELKIQKEMAECTFQPQIKADVVPSSGEPAPPVWERLLNYDKAQVIEEREKLKEQLEMQDCTFKPEVKSADSIPLRRSPSYNFAERLGSSAGDSLGGFVTRRPSSSPGRQTSDAKGVYIGQIIKSAKITLPTGRSPLTRTHSVSQPSSVSKPTLKRAASFVGPKSANTSPTPSGATEESDSSRLAFGREGTGSLLQASGVSEEEDGRKERGVATASISILENYDTWAANLEAKMRNL